MINPEHRALLKAICAAPEDDLRRLVFADYLEESGQPALIARAEFIRTQMELHNGQLSQDEHERFAQKARLLRAQFLDEADQLLAQRPDLEVRISSYKGFPFRLETDLSTFLLLGQTPLPDLAPIQSAHITRYTEARVEQPHSDESQSTQLIPEMRLMMIVSSEPRYPNLLSASLLNIPRHLASFVTGRFLQRGCFPRLEHLKIQVDGLHITDLMILATQLEENGFLGTLRELDLSEHPLQDDAGYFLCAAPAFQGLKKLRLTGHRFSSETQELVQRHFGERVIL